MSDEVNLSKKKFRLMITGFVIVVIIAVALSLLFAVYIPSHEKTKEINNYKKALFDSMLCQYSCPLTEQEYQNKTQLLPELNCVKACTESFKALNVTQLDITDTDARKDSLFSDIETLINNCKTSNIISGTVPSINNTGFFACSSNGLAVLKTKYSYLK